MRKSRAVQLNRGDAQDGLAARGGSRGRLLPLLLALLLLAPSLRPLKALASESGAQESAAQLAIPITVELVGDEGAPPDETYVIRVQAESIGRLPEGAYVTQESSEGTTADSLPVTLDEETLTLLVETPAGSFYVGPVTFDDPGGYVYTITQIPGDNPAITYDDTVYYFTVVVTRNADGELVMQAYAFREGLDEKVDEIVFTNIYTKPPKRDEPAPPKGEEPGEEPGTPSEEEPEESGTDSGTTEDDEDEEEEGEKETDELPPTEEGGPTGDDTPGDDTSGGPGSPLTGDDSQLLLYLLLAIASAAVLLALILVLVRRRKKAASGTAGEETPSETAEKEISFGTAEEETFAGDEEEEIFTGDAEEEIFTGDAGEESSAGTAQEKEQQPAETVDQTDADDNAYGGDNAEAGRPEIENED